MSNCSVVCSSEVLLRGSGCHCAPAALCRALLSACSMHPSEHGRALRWSSGSEDVSFITTTEVYRVESLGFNALCLSWGTFLLLDASAHFKIINRLRENVKYKVG